MAQQNINLGTAPGGTDGDTVRSAFNKTQANFSELYTNVASVTSTASTANATANTALGTANTANGTANSASTAAGTANTAISNAGIASQYSPQINMDQQQTSKFACYNPASSPTPPNSNSSFGTCININYGANQFCQLAISINTPVAAFRNYNNTWGGWYLIWHTGNTTVDANNFIKKV